MTTTFPQRDGHSTRGPVSLLREYRLYRFYNDAGVLLYVGMTGRRSLERLVEHLKTKLWARDIACWERDPRVWHNEQECLAAERAAIIGERPVHNVAHNGNNPGSPAVRRRPVWVDPVRPAGLSLWSRFWRATFGRWLLAKLIYTGKVAAVWAGLAVAAWVVVAVLAAKAGSPMPWQDSAGAGGFLACSAVGVWAARRSNRKARQTRRAPTRRRRTR